VRRIRYKREEEANRLEAELWNYLWAGSIASKQSRPKIQLEGKKYNATDNRMAKTVAFTFIFSAFVLQHHGNLQVLDWVSFPFLTTLKAIVHSPA